MCGIAGIAEFGSGNAVGSSIRRMTDTLHHRGPDDEGFVVEDNVAFGMRRLSVIDVVTGQQPYWNEDRTVAAVFNGEIYNYVELRNALEARGHRFAAHADGEVIVHLWEDHGPAFLSRLNGMFAIALYDARQRRVLIARDPMGIKPLYYSLDEARLVFGSEIKAILASGVVARDLDPDALAEFISWEYVPAPRTLFRRIRKLEPGTLLDVELSHGSSRVARWWQIPGEDPDDRRTDADWLAEADATLERAVRGQLVSDVPLGAFLSGGVDSSIIVSAMDEASTFSIGFDDATYSELRWAREVAEHLGIQPTWEVMSSRSALDLFDDLMLYMDDPIGDFSIFPTYLVSRLARQHVTVVLTGDGGDELFGGYETYVAQQRARLWNRIPVFLRPTVIERAIASLRPAPAKKGWVNKARRFAQGLEQPESWGHARWRCFVGEALCSELLAPALQRARTLPTGEHILRLNQEASGRDPVNTSLYVDTRSYLPDNCLVKVDRMSMACSLEARVPFLDLDVVNLAFRMPGRLKVRGGTTKPLLKDVAARRVPRRCVYRPKEGFSIPIKHWLRAELRPMLEECLAPERIRADGLFSAQTIERLKREHLSSRADHSHILWALLVFHDWRRRWSSC